ncbi:single-stranded-DNA-specific exonuclease RecJ [Candidatus Saccharibacteria bacterium]|nr:single-stranded-DNA-specific exonuclease RecJ [Candidatus Saccharibacteria bacterium]NCU40551.1 single-stranded-DNA-specific exonuclease RecJ [Candidatus Saccharibacteria bacterium]
MSLVDDILIARGYKTRQDREKFLLPKYERDSHDAFLLPDMDKAVARLVRAHDENETVVIYGDYDIDGLTASTILFDSFEKFGINASVYIPNRFIEGYGLTIEAVDKISDMGGQLIVTVDCGSLSHKEIVYAKKLGIDVIVTDHHSVSDTKSTDIAMINPKWLLQEYPEDYEDLILKKSSSRKIYPFLDLAGCGVAFKLVQALQTKLPGLTSGQEKWFLDLVALGTVCDVVQLKNENRMFVYWGLHVMQQTKRIGLKMLISVAQVELNKLNARSLGFGLGPRLNASGRLETAQYALDLLTSTSRTQARELAELLDTMNATRKTEQNRIFEEAEQQSLRYVNDKVLVVNDPLWNHGIVGIVAAKLLEKYHKPTFVLQELTDGTAKGSARSFGGFSAVEAIRATDDLLIKGGGHKLAAGVTLKVENIVAWRRAINAYYRRLNLSDQEKLFSPIEDVTVVDFSLVDESLWDSLIKFEPYGHGNPEPVFRAKEVVVADRRVMGENNQHVKYSFSDRKTQFQAIAWNSATEFTAEIGETVDVWFTLTLNEWRGRRTIEGQIKRILSKTP